MPSSGTRPTPAIGTPRRETPAAPAAAVGAPNAPGANPATSAAPAPAANAPAPRAPSPAAGEPAIAASQLPMVPRRETPPTAPTLGGTPRPATPGGATAVPIGSAPRAVTPAAGAGAAPRAPINPFLANDPNAKAKRLARALVSDMVAYHPNKREEGIRNGTLKQLFREEIKKSYEEYVEQIGKDFAETTSHFQDALNDVLAGGKKVF